jgi:hypothetical protein
MSQWLAATIIAWFNASVHFEKTSYASADIEDRGAEASCTKLHRLESKRLRNGVQLMTAGNEDGFGSRKGSCIDIVDLMIQRHAFISHAVIFVVPSL